MLVLEGGGQVYVLATPPRTPHPLIGTTMYIIHTADLIVDSVQCAGMHTYNPMQHCTCTLPPAHTVMILVLYVWIFQLLLVLQEINHDADLHLRVINQINSTIIIDN